MGLFPRRITQQDILEGMVCLSLSSSNQVYMAQLLCRDTATGDPASQLHSLRGDRVLVQIPSSEQVMAGRIYGGYLAPWSPRPSKSQTGGSTADT